MLLKGNLKKAGKDVAWVEKILGKRKAALRDTFLLTVDSRDQVVFYRKDGH